MTVGATTSTPASDGASKQQEIDVANSFYVEVVDLDGISHHIGPFKERSNARDWIAQNTLNRCMIPPRTPNGPELQTIGDFLIRE